MKARRPPITVSAHVKNLTKNRRLPTVYTDPIMYVSDQGELNILSPHLPSPRASHYSMCFKFPFRFLYLVRSIRVRIVIELTKAPNVAQR